MTDRVVVVRQPIGRISVTQDAVRVVVRSPGPPGPPGPAGTAGATGATGIPGGFVYEFTQADPVTPWVINHNIGVNPDVTILIGAEEVDADITHGSPNQTTVSFGSPQSGKARLRP